MSRTYLVVEGPHDVEFVGRILKLRGFKRVGSLKKLDEVWTRLVPRKFPADEVDLLRRHPLPTFFSDGARSVAVQSAVGDSKLLRMLEGTLAVLPRGIGDLSGVGLFLDADDAAPASRFHAIARGLSDQKLAAPSAPGQVVAGPPRCGVFVLPDNEAAGTLEDLLLECAEQTWPALLGRARGFVDSAVQESEEIFEAEREDLQKPSGLKKATIGCIATVFKPGKSVQVSIQDSRWLNDRTQDLPRVRQVCAFLDALVGLV